MRARFFADHSFFSSPPALHPQPPPRRIVQTRRQQQQQRNEEGEPPLSYAVAGSGGAIDDILYAPICVGICAVFTTNHFSGDRRRTGSRGGEQ